MGDRPNDPSNLRLANKCCTSILKLVCAKLLATFKMHIFVYTPTQTAKLMACSFIQLNISMEQETENTPTEYKTALTYIQTITEICSKIQAYPGTRCTSMEDLDAETVFFLRRHMHLDVLF